MIIFEVLTDIVFYNFGYWFLKLITFGKYPQKHDSEGGNVFVEALGFIVMGVILFLVYYIINKYT